MKYIKLFELKKETYISAADKLKEIGHRDRAKNLYAYAHRFIDKLDANKYNIDFPLGDIRVKGIFNIVDLKPNLNTHIVILQSIDSKIEIMYGKKGDEKLSFWIKQIEPKDTKLYPNFKFSNRKDAVNFKKFLVDQLQDDKFIEYYKDIRINDIYI